MQFYLQNELFYYWSWYSHTQPHWLSGNGRSDCVGHWCDVFLLLLVHFFSTPVLKTFCNLLWDCAELLRCWVILVKIRLYEVRTLTWDHSIPQIYIWITLVLFCFLLAAPETRVCDSESWKNPNVLANRLKSAVWPHCHGDSNLKGWLCISLCPSPWDGSHYII